MASQAPVKGLIFDLGDVLFQWSRSTKTAISPGMMKKILSSPPWYDYECGRLSRAMCYEQVAQQYRLDVSQVAEAFAQARASLQPDAAVVAFLKDLRRNSPIKVYAMSNVAKEDFAALTDKMDPMLFDCVFTSGAHGMRKPDPDFYREVLQEIKMKPEQVMFIDDKHENVLAANRVGIRGLVFDNETVHTLQDMLHGPVARGYDYLQRSGKQFDSVTDSGVSVGDNFAKLLILEATQDPGLVDVELNSKGTWNFFSGEATLIPGGYFPDDLDTTSLALTVVPPEQPEVVTAILDQLAEYVTSNGLFLTYFDREKPRTDAVVNANVLGCFYRFGRGHQFPHTLQYIYDIVLHRAYLNGTRYYSSADCCLGFFSRLLRFAKSDPYVRSTLGPLLRSRLEERAGEKGSALDLAMRIIACDSMGIECSVDRETLLRLQCEDGSWEPGWMYKYGSSGVQIGNRGATTAIALKAIASSAGISKVVVGESIAGPGVAERDLARNTNFSNTLPFRLNSEITVPTPARTPGPSPGPDPETRKSEPPEPVAAALEQP